MQGQTRKFGLVAADIVDVDLFNEAVARYGGKFAPGRDDHLSGHDGDAGQPGHRAGTSAGRGHQAQGRRRHLGNPARRHGDNQRDDQAGDRAGVPPEWIYAGAYDVDLPLLPHGAPKSQAQWAHAFGISNVPPGSKAATTAPQRDPVVLGSRARAPSELLVHEHDELAVACDHAGRPEPHAEGPEARVMRGACARGLHVHRIPSTAVRTTRTGYGPRSTGLPYDECLSGGHKDWTTSWWDPETEGPPQLGFPASCGRPRVPQQHQALPHVEVAHQDPEAVPTSQPTISQLDRAEMPEPPSQKLP